MTVSYQYDVASTSSGGFIRLLFKWKGSVWKLVYTELLLLIAAYGFLSLLYRQALTESQKRVFELLVYYCSTFMEMIPLSFMLGFYVTFTATRWWNQYMAIPWPDRLMNVLMMYVPGQDDDSRMLRRTLMRYLNLSLILVLRSISKAVKRRFPTKDHLIEAGFMTKLEMDLWQSIPSTEFNTFWVPCTWFINLLREARNECRITDAQGVKLILEEFNDFRAKCGLLWSYDWISIPLVYTQVVTLATYSFFGAALFGRQYIRSPDPIIDNRHHFDFYVPVFTVIQYFLYMGLLKVAEQLINPFGDDDEDFELNWIIDRHFKVSYLGVDTLDGPPPPLVKDSYFYKMDYQLPYTAASVSYKKKTYRGSVAYMHVPHEKRGMVVPEMSEEDDEDSPSSGGDNADVGGPLSKRSSSSLWTLMQRRQSGSPQDSLESGLQGESTLHVYFKGPSPSGSQDGSQEAEENSAINDASSQKHLLHAPAERRSALKAGGESSPMSGQRSFLRELFSSKAPQRVQAWTGADGDYYGSPAKKPRRPHHRTKVSFCAETSGRPRFDNSSLRHKSRSTSDLAADVATSLEPLPSIVPDSSSGLDDRRKSLESGALKAAYLSPLSRRGSSIPDLTLSSDEVHEDTVSVPPPLPPPLVPALPTAHAAPTLSAASTTTALPTVPMVAVIPQVQPVPTTPPKKPVRFRPPEMADKEPLPTPEGKPDVTSGLVTSAPRDTSSVTRARADAPEKERAVASRIPAVLPRWVVQTPPPDSSLETPDPNGTPSGSSVGALTVPPWKSSKLPPATSPTVTTLPATGTSLQVTMPSPAETSPLTTTSPLAIASTPTTTSSSITAKVPVTTTQETPVTTFVLRSRTRAKGSPEQVTEPATSRRRRLRVRVTVPDDSIPDVSKVETAPEATFSPTGSPLSPSGNAPEPAPDKSPSQTPPPEPPDRVKDSGSSMQESASQEGKTLGAASEVESDNTEFVVMIQEGAADRPKQLIIVPGPPQRAGSVDSLIGDARQAVPKRRASLDSPLAGEGDAPPFQTEQPKPSPESDRKQGTPAATVPASSRRRRRSEQLRRRSIARRRRSSSSSESEESAEAIAAAVIAAAAPVHRRVPSDVLMRWQNVPRRDPGSCEELDRPRLGSGGSGSRPPGTPPPPGRVKMLSHEFTLLSAVSSSVLVRSSTATSVSSAASKADAFIASEKHQS